MGVLLQTDDGEASVLTSGCFPHPSPCLHLAGNFQKEMDAQNMILSGFSFLLRAKLTSPSYVLLFSSGVRQSVSSATKYSL